MPSQNQQIIQLNNLNRYTVYTLPDYLRNNSNAYGFLTKKEAPRDLSNDINSSSEAVGATIYVLNKSYQILYATNKFYLTSFNFGLKERAQLINSLTSPIISFFGESIRVYTFTGVAPDAGSTSSVNTYKNFQYSSLIQLYNNHLRGTKLIEDGNFAMLKVANHTIYGFPVNLNSSYSSAQDKIASFTMNWAVAKHDLFLINSVSTTNLQTMYDVTDKIDKDKELFIEEFLKFKNNVIVILGYGLQESMPSEFFKVTKKEMGEMSIRLINLYTNILNASNGEEANINEFSAQINKTMKYVNNVYNNILLIAYDYENIISWLEQVYEQITHWN